MLVVLMWRARGVVRREAPRHEGRGHGAGELERVLALHVC